MQKLCLPVRLQIWALNEKLLMFNILLKNRQSWVSLKKATQEFINLLFFQKSFRTKFLLDVPRQFHF
jgi:hypothetical protein